MPDIHAMIGGPLTLKSAHCLAINLNYNIGGGYGAIFKAFVGRGSRIYKLLHQLA